MYISYTSVVLIYSYSSSLSSFRHQFLSSCMSWLKTSLSHSLTSSTSMSFHCNRLQNSDHESVHSYASSTHVTRFLSPVGDRYIHNFGQGWDFSVPQKFTDMFLQKCVGSWVRQECYKRRQSTWHKLTDSQGLDFHQLLVSWVGQGGSYINQVQKSPAGRPNMQIFSLTCKRNHTNSYFLSHSLSSSRLLYMWSQIIIWGWFGENKIRIRRINYVFYTLYGLSLWEVMYQSPEYRLIW